MMLSKTSVLASHRGKLHELVRQSGLELVLVVPSQWDRDAYEPAPDEPFRTIVAPIRLNGRNHFHWYPGFRRILASERPDLLHVDEEHYSLVTALAFREAVRLRIPALFVTWQNLFKRYPLPFSALERFVLRHAAGAMAGNAEAAEVLRQKGYRGPLAVIPQFGIDADVFRPRSAALLRTDWGLSEQARVVGYVGRLVPEKGVDTLVEAMVPILRERDDVRLLVVGAGPMKPRLEHDLAGAGHRSRARVLPWVPRSRMPELMGVLDILVLPSRTTARWKEQFGRVLTEAMAAEVTVVGSDSGEIPRVINNGGMVFEEGNARHLREVLTHLLDRPDERRTLAQAGRARVLQHYTPSVVASQLLAFYRTVLGEGAPDPAGP